MDRTDYINRLRSDACILLDKEKLCPKVEFDMNNFGSHEGKNHAEAMNYCGTTACALGTIAISGRSAIRGRWEDGDAGYNGERSWSLKISLRGADSEEYEFEVAQRYYGIDAETAGDIFGGPYDLYDADTGPADVAMRMLFIAQCMEKQLPIHTVFSDFAEWQMNPEEYNDDHEDDDDAMHFDVVDLFATVGRLPPTELARYAA